MYSSYYFPGWYYCSCMYGPKNVRAKKKQKINRVKPTSNNKMWNIFTTTVLPLCVDANTWYHVPCWLSFWYPWRACESYSIRRTALTMTRTSPTIVAPPRWHRSFGWWRGIPRTGSERRREHDNQHEEFRANEQQLGDFLVFLVLANGAS